MPEALAALAVVLAALALLVATRAAGAARAARRAVDEGGPRPGRGAGVPAAPPAALSPTPATDPSVLVRLDALESRAATLELRASLASTPPAAAEGTEGAGARRPPDDPARRPYPVFP